MKSETGIFRVVVFALLLAGIVQMVQPVQAEYVTTASSTPLRDGKGVVFGMPVKRGYLFCIRRGAPFRKSVSEWQYIYIESGHVESVLRPEPMRVLKSTHQEADVVFWDYSIYRNNWRSWKRYIFYSYTAP